jgi:hypothetical protein
MIDLEVPDESDDGEYEKPGHTLLGRSGSSPI